MEKYGALRCALRMMQAVQKFMPTILINVQI